MASGRVPNTVNTFTVTLLYLSFAVCCLFNLNDFYQATDEDVSGLSQNQDGRRRESTTPAPTNTPIAPHRTIIKARRGLSRLTGSSGVRK